jgi:hypothetical protein
MYQFLQRYCKIVDASLQVFGATFLQMVQEVIQYPLATFPEGIQNPLANSGRLVKTLWKIYLRL